MAGWYLSVLVFACGLGLLACDSSGADSAGSANQGDQAPGQAELFPVGGTFDFTYEGDPDCTLVDANGDGLSDGLDFDGDGLPNALLLDTNGDGISDAIDTDGDKVGDAFLIGPNEGNVFGLGTTAYSGDPVVLLDDDNDGYFDGLDVDYDFIADFDISQNL